MNIGKIFQALLWLIYPFAIFFGLQFFEPRVIAIFLIASLLLKRFNDAGRFLKTVSRYEIGIFACMLCLASVTAIANSELLLRLYPAAMTVGMLLIFSISLLKPPTIIERLARLREPDLPPAGITYTRHVTQIWCGFFVLNALIAIYTALITSKETWALYNGLIVYLLMGALFSGEWLFRRFILKREA